MEEQKQNKIINIITVLGHIPCENRGHNKKNLNSFLFNFFDLLLV